MKKLSGFTLVEILISVSIIIILASIMLFSNIKSGLEKARDSTRKQDIHKLVRFFEDYYNDKQSYPTNNQSNGTILNTPWGEKFPNYPVVLPLDPLNPNRHYYYETDPNDQHYFALYAKLENTADQDIITSGCQAGCGPNLAYNYAVHSPNIVLVNGLPQNSYLIGGGGDTGPNPTLTPAGGGGGPNLSLTPPPPIGGACGYDQCCYSQWCGAPSTAQGGVYCVQDEKCWWDGSYGWLCFYEPLCP